MKRSSAIYTKTYAIHDLVIPNTTTHNPAPDFAPVMTAITATVRPDTWEDAGGFNSIKEFPQNLTLIISADDQTHEQVADVLDEIRSVNTH